MSKKKNQIIITVLIVSMLIILSTGIFHIVTNLSPKTISTNIHEALQNEDINDVSLTIYYMPPSTESVIPLSLDILIARCEREDSSTYKFVVSGSELIPHIDKLTAMDEYMLTVIKPKDAYVNARVYYVLESSKNGKLLEVLLCNTEGMLVNNIHVEENEYFYNFITPFLSKDAAADWLSPLGSPYWKSHISGQDV